MFSKIDYKINPFWPLTCVCWVLLAGCGSDDEVSAQSTESTIPPVVSPEPVTCDNDSYTVISASDSNSEMTSFTPEKAIDGDLASVSRWQSSAINREITFDLGSEKQISAITAMWFQGSKQVTYFDVSVSTNAERWTPIVTNGQSSGRHSGYELISFDSIESRYIKIATTGTDSGSDAGIVELQVHKCSEATGEYTDTFPNEVGIELLDWYLSIPTDEDNSGTADNIGEEELAAGYTHSEYFYASQDNGIVMRSPGYGFKTSANTNYVRVELREMLRRGDSSVRTQGVNKNNWVFGSASSQNQENAGGVDGDLRVTMAVNKVTTTGENYQIGRLVIGQNHANDDEPVRLYYRKLPGNERGSVYFAHESRETDSDGDTIETYVEILGSRSNNAADPADGIALNEVFSYHISVSMNLLTVTLSREGKADVVVNYDMTNSLYDAEDQYHYFKVGVYHLNNSSEPDEFAQATFYEIRNSHTGYAASE